MHEFEMAQAPDQRHGPHRPIDVNGDAAGTLVIERELPHPPEKVWRALASASLLGEWLMPTDFRPVPGSKFKFYWPPGARRNRIVEGEVLVAEPPARLAFTWRIDPLESEASWTLTPSPRGVVVRMEHTSQEYKEERRQQGYALGLS